MQTCELELKLDSVKEILEDYRATAHPEKAFLNEFESALQGWVRTCLGSNERIVIFIDDLDRCMPDVALEVLEALKLYLNIEGLIFVVGVDKVVIEELVKGYYNKLGLDGKKSKNYLAKMFQVEIEVEPNEGLILKFLDDQLDGAQGARGIDYWNKLESDKRSMFRDVFVSLARHNPREIKRLINSALMAAAGFLMMNDETDIDNSIASFEQALQVYLVGRVLGDVYDKAHIVRRDTGSRFFKNWSSVVRENPRLAKTVSVPAGYIMRRQALLESTDSAQPVDQEEISTDKFAHEAYHGLVENPDYIDFLQFLNNRELGCLMQIPYPDQASQLAKIMSTSTETDKTLAVIINRLKLESMRETERDEALKFAESLDLSNADICDLQPLAQMRAVTALDLSNTRITSLEPIRRLVNLQSLSLTETNVEHLDPIRRLFKLRELNLRNTQVANLEPLKELTALKRLSLHNTQISRLDPLCKIACLEELTISGTLVGDLTPLFNLTQMQRLYLADEQAMREQARELQGAVQGLRVIYVK